MLVAVVEVDVARLVVAKMVVVVGRATVVVVLQVVCAATVVALQVVCAATVVAGAPKSIIGYADLR